MLRNVLFALMIAFLSPAYGTSAQKATTPKPNKPNLTSEKVKELLLLMDTDKNGKISKGEWMKYMSAEFDRLDKDKSGELDPKELMESRVSVRPAYRAYQGK